MKLFNKVLSALLSSALLLQTVAFADVSDSKIIINECFDNIVTNKSPDTLTFTGAKGIVVEDAAYNKALKIGSNGDEMFVRANLETFPKEFVINSEIKTLEGNPSLTVGFASSATDVNDSALIKISNSEISTVEGKLLGTLSKNSYNKLSLVIYNGELFDVYINDRMVADKWPMQHSTKKGYLSIKKTADENSGVLLDNLFVYGGTDIKKQIGGGTYNSDWIDEVGASNEAGDDTFFDSRYIWTSGDPHYVNLISAPKTNSIEYARYDYKNPTRETYIHLDRTDTGNDCFFDICLDRFAYTKNLDKTFPYYYVEADYKVEKPGAEWFILFRDNSTSANADYYPIEGLPDGSIKLAGGSAYSSVATKGKIFNLKIFINMKQKYCDVYIDNKLAGIKMPLPENFKKFKRMRTSLYTAGKGDLYIDNMVVRGINNPVIDGEYQPTSIYPTDDAVKKFLSDKVAFHAYGDYFFAGGEKNAVDGKPVYEKDLNEYFVPVSTVNKAFGTNFAASENGISDGSISVGANGKINKNGETDELINKMRYADGEYYVPISEFCEKVLSRSVFFFKTGLILVSDKILKLKADDWNYFCFRGDTSDISIWNDLDFLNAYMQYERPTTEKMLEDFKKIDPEMNSHPRVYMTAADFEEHRAQYKTNEQYKKIADDVIKMADDALESEEFTYKYDDAMRMLNTATAVWEKFSVLGYAYNMTGDKKYLDKAYKDILSLDKFPDFNTSHIIDTGYFAQGLGIAYDWFYNGFTDEQRETAKRVCFDKCLKSLAGIHYGEISSASNGSKGWGSAKGGSNYNGMINGGIIAAAIATMECDSEYCTEAVNNSMRSMEYILQNLMPGGGWSEGVFYWDYGLKNVMSSIVSIKNAFGSDYGLSKSMGMKDTLNFASSALGVDGANNFHDSSNTYSHSFPIFMTLSKILGDTNAFKIRIADLDGYDRVDKSDAFFYNFDAEKDIASDTAKLPNALKTDGVELFSIRDSYDPKEAKFYFSTHFGITSGYHTHNDTGTFVLDMLGKRFAEDLGSENYNLENELGYKQTDIYRKRAEGHNVIVLNPDKDFNQTGGLFVPITKYASNENGGYVVTDMQGVYKDTTRMKLGYYIDDNMNSLTMRNEFSTAKKSTAYWFMHTKANVLIDGNTAILSRDGKSVKLEFQTNGSDASISEMAAAPLETSPQVPEQNKNEGYRKIAIKFTASGDTNLTVKISPLGMSVSPMLTTPIDEWVLPEKKNVEAADLSFEVLYNGDKVTSALPVYDGVMPELTVVPNNPENIVEIQQAKTADEKTIIKVWDKTKSYYNVFIVTYFKASGKSMLMYNSIPIKSVEVSSEPEPQNSKENMLDGDMTTRWTCMAKGEYAIFDLGEVKDVAGCAIAFWKGGERNYFFDLYVSEDGQNYYNVYQNGTSAGDGENLSIYEFDGVQKARYIKFVGKGNTSVNSLNSNVLEFKAIENKF